MRVTGNHIVQVNGEAGWANVRIYILNFNPNFLRKGFDCKWNLRKFRASKTINISFTILFKLICENTGEILGYEIELLERKIIHVGKKKKKINFVSFALILKCHPTLINTLFINSKTLIISFYLGLWRRVQSSLRSIVVPEMVLLLGRKRKIG